MSLALTLGVGAAITLTLMFVLWLLQMKTSNAGWGDVGWAFSFAFTMGWYAWACQGNTLRSAVGTAVVALWCARLGLHLVLRLLADHEEDGRYLYYRSAWGAHIQIKFLAFFLAQGVFEFVFSLPFLAIALNTAPFPHPFEIAAAAIIVVGVIGEGIADAQLRAWKSNPANKGKTCRAGLWSVSRHPNYFFEWLIWVAWALAASAGGGAAWSAWIAPAGMLFLLCKVSGIPPTEAQSVRSRGDDYRKYQREVSALFPWFPKKSA
jgi:steroid 5-alpha reductase family enzyme